MSPPPPLECWTNTATPGNIFFVGGGRLDGVNQKDEVVNLRALLKGGESLKPFVASCRYSKDNYLDE